MTYDVSGNGQALLLIPGLGGAASFWNDISAILAETYRVISFDHRGTGRSERPAGPYSISRIACDAVEILRQEGIAAANIVGHSTGGMVAQFIALDAPSIVKTLVISGSWEKPDARFKTMFEARMGVLREAGPKVYQKLTHALGFPAEFLAENAKALETAISDAPDTIGSIEVALARMAMLFSDERSAELCGIHAPTLVIGASDDALIPFYHSQRLAALIPGAQLEVIDGAHFYPRVHPHRFATVVRDFVETANG